MPHHAALLSWTGALWLAAMWIAMMGAMMAPTAWPWVATFGRLVSPVPGAARLRAVGVFTAGYLAAWSIYSVTLAAAQIGLARAGQWHDAVGVSPLVAAAILASAGAYQLAPVKAACLRHCRNPLTYFLARWHDGPSGFRLGFAHGMFCVGCCWALMATALAVGVMSLVWMAALTLVVFIEQVVPGGDRLRCVLGLALLAGAAAEALAVVAPLVGW
ncbi:MAG TPA: DUF2182 domain-containing protein [Vicinamibacterales bacterium]|jgi:predicted metal-binding membrane protein